MIKGISCPHCKSKKIVKRGYFNTKKQGKQQRYYCRECNKKFIPQTPFYRMRNSPQKITLCLDLFYRGVSTRKVQEHLQAFYPHNSSHKSIYKWIVKYSKQISQYTDNLKLNVGSEIQLDEMEYKTKGKQSWFIDCIDSKTRFLVASNYVKSRNVKEIKNVLRKAKKKTAEQVKVVTTDGLHSYPKALRGTFGLNKLDGKTKIKHNRVNASKGEGFNIMIERLHNSIRQRTKTFRGFHGSIESANAIMKGLEVYYNFITKHQALNKCPYELATGLKLTKHNKWLELIELATN